MLAQLEHEMATNLDSGFCQIYLTENCRRDPSFRSWLEANYIKQKSLEKIFNNEATEIQLNLLSE